MQIARRQGSVYIKEIETLKKHPNSIEQNGINNFTISPAKPSTVVTIMYAIKYFSRYCAKFSSMRLKFKTPHPLNFCNCFDHKMFIKSIFVTFSLLPKLRSVNAK